MKKIRVKAKEVLAEFGNNHAEVARTLDITRQAVRAWGDFVPPKHHVRLARSRPGKWGYLVRL